MSKILITGGAGYIASHTCVELLAEGHDLVLVDNFCNSSYESVRRLQEIAGREVSFHEGDLRNPDDLESIFSGEKGISAVVHFAALKAVGESVEKPLRYYENNITGSLNLYRAMDRHDVRQIVFSSSATVYGDPDFVPIKEDAPVHPASPYGHTKAMMEQILIDTADARDWSVGILRYFNPVGAHESGRIGEDPDYPNNLLPFVSQVAIGLRDKVMVFGDDWPTPDGTGVRDYIHVVDLAKAHLKTLDKIDTAPGTSIWNIGTGKGYSVLEMIEAFGEVCGKPVPYEIGPRRAGDVADLVADPSKANADLGWAAQHDLKDMVASAWKWQTMNPKGYRE